MAGVIVRPRSRIFHGHDWVYRSEVVKVYGEPADGDVVSIKDGRDHLLGTGFYSTKSPIAVRRFSRARQKVDEEFLRRRILRAWELRQRFGIANRPCRAFWSEADGLPGLILDKYGETVVLQALTAGVERFQEQIGKVTREVLEVERIVVRNDGAGRTSEGLPKVPAFFQGEVLAEQGGEEEGKIRIEIGAAKFELDFLRGHKTGFYLDQVDNYPKVAQWAEGRRVLDGFCNNGGFAIFAGLAGAAEVVAVDSSEVVCAQARKNFKLNLVKGRVECADVADFLRRAARGGEKFGLVVLDPPPFARSGGSVAAALRGYRDLHRCAAQVLEERAVLATFCCSHNVSQDEFLSAVAAGLWDSGRTARVVEILGQSADHPVLAHLPETQYLKGFVLEIIP